MTDEIEDLRRELADKDAEIATLRDQLAEAVKGLEWYGRAGNTASIENAENGDIDMSRASIVLAGDCGDIARATLDKIRGGK